jgi:hypothetical protein
MTTHTPHSQTPQIKVFDPTIRARFLGFVLATFYHPGQFDIAIVPRAHARLPRVAGRMLLLVVEPRCAHGVDPHTDRVAARRCAALRCAGVSREVTLTSTLSQGVDP